MEMVVALAKSAWVQHDSVDRIHPIKLHGRGRYLGQHAPLEGAVAVQVTQSRNPSWWLAYRYAAPELPTGLKQCLADHENQPPLIVQKQGESLEQRSNPRPHSEGPWTNGKHGWRHGATMPHCSSSGKGKSSYPALHTQFHL